MVYYLGRAQIGKAHTHFLIFFLILFIHVVSYVCVMRGEASLKNAYAHCTGRPIDAE